MGLYCDVIRLSDREVEKCVELSDEKAIYALLQQSRRDDWFDIDKAWYGVHFILNSAYSTETPIGFLLHGGRLLNDRNWEDMYGVDVPDMRAFDSVQIRERLETTAESRSRTRFNVFVVSGHKFICGPKARSFAREYLETKSPPTASTCADDTSAHRKRHKRIALSYFGATDY